MLYKIVYKGDNESDESQIVETEYVRIFDGILFLESKTIEGTRPDAIFNNWKRITKIKD